MLQAHSNKIETLANASIALAAILAAAVLIKSLVATRPRTETAAVTPQAQAAEPLASGARLPLRGVEWASRTRTLVLVLSTKCHFCSESAPFYRRLTALAAEHSDRGFVAALPEPEDAGRVYLDGLNVKPAQILQARLSSLGIRGTPTLVLVDSGGVVLNSWTGRLSAAREAEVIRQF